MMSENRNIAILHNHPIYYKHILFAELARRRCSFEVVFSAGSSANRLEGCLPANDEYPYRVIEKRTYQEASAITVARGVLSALEAINPKIVVISGYYDVAAWTAWAWGCYRGRGLVLWAESTQQDKRKGKGWREYAKRLFVRKCHAAQVYGRSSAIYIQSLGMNSESIFVGGAIVDVTRFIPAVEDEYCMDGTRLLYVGRLSEEKNVAAVLNAIGAVSRRRGKSDISLTIVGYGVLEDQLRQLSCDLGIDDRVEFAGKVLQDRIVEYYHACDVLILPSTSEPWGLVVNEAMLCGRPALVSDKCGCVCDLVTRNTGWTFSPDDEEALVRVIDKIADLPRSVLREMGRHAHARAADFNPSVCADQLLKAMNRAERRCEEL